MVFGYPWFSRDILKIQNKKDYYSFDDKNELQNTAFRPNFIHFRVNSENFECVYACEKYNGQKEHAKRRNN